MDFNIFQAYERAARRGLVQPLTCKEDDFELKLIANDCDEPMLHCYFCGNNIVPGSALVDRINRVLQRL